MMNNDKALNEEDILNKDIIDNLYPYQIDELCRKTRSYLELNKQSDLYHFDCCPKCGCKSEYFKRGGYTYKKDKSKSKPLLRCPICGKRFVIDHGQLTYYSRLDKGTWSKIIEDTIIGKSLSETAADINKHTITVFRNRHKLLNHMELIEDSKELESIIELDEKYVHESHKGLLDAKVDDENKIIEVTTHKKHHKPGLGHDQICIVTALQREKDSYVCSYNSAKPSIEDIKPLEKHIKDNSFIFTDGIRVYEQMFKKKNCKYKELVGISSYDEINHLNNVNSFHSRISQYNKQYRNVSSIYINRYNALYSLRQRFLGFDIKEIILNLLSSLRKIKHYFFQRQINKDDLFNDYYVLKARENLMPAIQYAKLLKSGYKAIIIKAHEH